MSIDRGDHHMKEEIGKWWEEFEKWSIEVKEGRCLKSRWNGVADQLLAQLLALVVPEHRREELDELQAELHDVCSIEAAAGPEVLGDELLLGDQ